MTYKHMIQAITTKYLGPTNTLGARVKATCEAKSITVGWNNALNVEENHAATARKLFLSLGWDVKGKYRLVGGALPGSGYCFVIVEAG